VILLCFHRVCLIRGHVAAASKPCSAAVPELVLEVHLRQQHTGGAGITESGQNSLRKTAAAEGLERVRYKQQPSGTPLTFGNSQSRWGISISFGKFSGKLRLHGEFQRKYFNTCTALCVLLAQVHFKYKFGDRS
jgi:hypothetical protein